MKVCVVLRHGAACSAADLDDHCAARMPDFARPRFFDLMEALPKTPTQKVRKAELREAGVTATTWVSPSADQRRARRDAHA